MSRKRSGNVQKKGQEKEGGAGQIRERGTLEAGGELFNMCFVSAKKCRGKKMLFKEKSLVILSRKNTRTRLQYKRGSYKIESNYLTLCS